MIAGILGPGLTPGRTLGLREDNFEMEISQVDASAVPSSGYAIDFMQNNVDEAILPASFFSSRGDSVLSSSLISQMAVFRGRNKTVYFASKIFSISVIGEGSTILSDPVTVTFRTTTNVRTYYIFYKDGMNSFERSQPLG